jgi:hypothetical protein
MYAAAPNFFGLGFAAALEYILRFRSTTMADKYRIAQDGSDFIVNYGAGGTVGVYGTASSKTGN